MAYLVNVTLRPGYQVANAEDALAYGRGICDAIAQGRSYAEIVGTSMRTSQHLMTTKRHT